MSEEMTLSNERLAEMLAGLDGVTHGPWYHVKGRGAFQLGWEVGAPDGAISASPKAEVSAHIARCDPGTIRSIITELQALRASSGVEVKGLEWRKEAQWAQARCRAVGLITVTQTDGRWDWRIEGSLCRSQCMSIDEAIAEVEEERIARILSCLSSPLPTVEVTEEEKAKREAIDLLLSAADVWADYGSGFRVHFSFPPGGDIRVVERINTARSLSALSQNKGEE